MLGQSQTLPTAWIHQHVQIRTVGSSASHQGVYYGVLSEASDIGVLIGSSFEEAIHKLHKPQFFPWSNILYVALEGAGSQPARR